MSSNTPNPPPVGFFDFHAQVTRRRPARDPTAPAPPPSQPGSATPPPEPLTVTQLTKQIDRVLKTGMPATILVKGELSAYRRHAASGHIYLTLKDRTSCIDGVMWRDDGARLVFEPEVGMELLATGRIGVYLERGRYQLYVTDLRPLGQGALELAFRQLCERLEREGLFAAERKRPLPPYPRRVVLMTSLQTAALQDMLKVLRRYSWLKLFLYHVPVQGEAAGKEMAAALRHLDRHQHTLAGGRGADLVVLGRGGGSLEDLWCFNDETLARAIAASRLPVVTGIGHEVDTSIADLVADYHAHTPTEAAQVVAHHWRTAPEVVESAAVRLRRAVRQRVADARQRLTAVERHEAFRRPLFRVYMFRQLMDDREKALALMMGDRLRELRRRLGDIAERVDRHHPSLLIARIRNGLRVAEQRLDACVRDRVRDETGWLSAVATRLAERHPRHRVRLGVQRLAGLEGRLKRAAAEDMARRKGHLEALARQLFVVGPEQVLRRGFSLTIRKKDGQIIRSAAQVRPGDRMITRFADGQVEWTAEDPRQPLLFQ